MELERTFEVVPGTIHRLSDDILLLLFTGLRNSALGVDRKWVSLYEEKWDWLTVTHICRSWRNSALSTPSLWTHLHDFNNGERTKAFLERSKNMDLFVFLNNKSFYDELGDKRLSSFVSLPQAMVRTQSLHITLSPYQYETTKEIFKSLRCPAPRLKSICILSDEYIDDIATHQYDFATHKFAKLPGLGFAPRLEILELLSITIPKNMYTLNGIKKLTLREIHNLSQVALLSALASWSDLKELIISDVVWDTRVDANSTLTQSDIRVSLPHLELLEFEFPGLFSAGEDEILHHIDFPRTAAWRLSYEAERRETLLNNMKIYASYIKRLAKCEDLSIGISAFGLTIRSGYNVEKQNTLVRAPETKLDLHFKAAQHPSALYEHVESLIKSSCWQYARSVTMDMTLDYYIIEEGHWRGLMSALPSTRSLRFSFTEEYELEAATSIENCMKVLMHGNDTPGVCNGIVCPKLRNLVFIFKEQISDAKNFVRNLGDLLRNRKQMGLQIWTVLINTPQPIEEDVQMLSEYAEKIDWSVSNDKNL